MSEISTAGSLHLDELPDSLREWLAQQAPGEVVWGAIETGSERDEGDVWLVATDRRNVLAAASDDGRYWLDLPLYGETETDTAFARRKFLLDGEEVFDASRLGGADLIRLFELAFQARPHGLRAAALDHVSKGKWEEADTLFGLALEACDESERDNSVAYLDLSQKIRLRRAQCALETEREGEAVVIVAEVSAERERDDLVAASREMHETAGWLLTLALAHEEAGDPSSAAKVYAALLEAEPKQDLFILSAARAHRRAGEFDDAVAAFDRFVEGRAHDDVATRIVTTSADPEELDSDPDLTGACLESAELYEELRREHDAALRYLTLIRHAPFSRDAYAKLFAIRDALPASDVTVQMAAEVFRLLQPDALAEVDALPPEHEAFDLPRDYAELPDEEHDQRLVHPGERGSTSVAQRWLGALTKDERNTQDIERHARRVDGSKYPDALALLRSVAAMLSVDEPRLFLSFGSSGIDVLGSDNPFVLLGACHLDPDDDRHLSIRELAFALGSQVEHIKANHLILTSSEFWKTFGTKSAATLLAFLPLGDIVSKFTDKSVLKWVGKVKDTAESRVTRSLLDLAESRVTEGATKEGVQSAYTAALAKVRQVALSDEEGPDEEDRPSMVKEQLADFARAAQYTADRTGFLVCDDLATAMQAMLRLSPTGSSFADGLDQGGLFELLSARNDDGEHAHEELALRIGELIKFALSDDYAKLRSIVAP